MKSAIAAPATRCTTLISRFILGAGACLLIALPAGAQVNRTRPQVGSPPLSPPLPPQVRTPMPPPAGFQGRNFTFQPLQLPSAPLWNRTRPPFMYDPTDPGGLRWLNNPTLRLGPNPLDPGGLTNLNNPSLLLNPNPLDPLGFTRVNNPALLQRGPAGGYSSYDRFNHSAEGFRYRYDNGAYGRQGFHAYYGALGAFFPAGMAFYPYYSDSYLYGLTCPSPYAYLYGAFPPFIYSSDVFPSPPQYVYVPYPVYENGQYSGQEQSDVQNYYLNRPQNGQTDHFTVGPELQKQDMLLSTAIGDVEAAWTKGDIQTLAGHVRRDARIAVFLRGKYQYSLSASDYLDMTRDALRSTHTVSFELQDASRDQNGVYTVTGTHVYKDKQGAEHTVIVTYVFQKEDGGYYITQVGSAPQDLNQK